MSHLNFKFVRSANLLNLQPISCRRIWCFASTFSCLLWFHVAMFHKKSMQTN